VHSDYPTIVEQDAVNRRVAPEWASDPREGPVPYTLTRNPVVMKDRLFLCVVYGTYQKETPIIEMALDGSVQRVWVIPAECGQPLSYAVEMADGWPVFWVGFSFPEPYVARMTASR
jgi:hypothetical protein